MSPGRRLVIGVGNPDAGDDAAGRLVARRLGVRNHCAAAEPHVIRECSGEATALMEAWTGFDDVVLVDASHGAGAVGSVHRFEGVDLERLAGIEPRPRGSTHGLGVWAAVALARALRSLPCRLVIYAIEGRQFDAGGPLSPEVDHAVDELVALLVQQQPVRAEPVNPAGET